VVRERQDRTTELASFLWEQYADAAWAWVPMIQGWRADDYTSHAEELAPLVMEMRHWGWDREDPDEDAIPPAGPTRSELASALCVEVQVRASSVSSRLSCLASRFTCGARESQHPQERRGASSAGSQRRQRRMERLLWTRHQQNSR